MSLYKNYEKKWSLACRTDFSRLNRMFGKWIEHLYQALAVVYLTEGKWIALIFRFHWWPEDSECGKLFAQTKSCIAITPLGKDRNYQRFQTLIVEKVFLMSVPDVRVKTICPLLSRGSQEHDFIDVHYNVFSPCCNTMMVCHWINTEY